MKTKITKESERGNNPKMSNITQKWENRNIFKVGSITKYEMFPSDPSRVTRCFFFNDLICLGGDFYE